MLRGVGFGGRGVCVCVCVWGGGGGTRVGRGWCKPKTFHGRGMVFFFWNNPLVEREDFIHQK